MRRLAAGVVMAVALTALMGGSAAAVGPKAYVGLFNDNAIGVIDTGTNRTLRTIPLGLQAFFFEYAVEWGYLFAALSMATVPVIVVYVLMQRQFIKGLTAGAVKG